jgi:hypothetical protein
MDAWLDNADWLILPGLYYYDSFDQLIQMLETFEDIHSDLRWRYITESKERILGQWKMLLQPIMSSSYFEEYI